MLKKQCEISNWQAEHKSMKLAHLSWTWTILPQENFRRKFVKRLFGCSKHDHYNLCQNFP